MHETWFTCCTPIGILKYEMALVVSPPCTNRVIRQMAVVIASTVPRFPKWSLKIFAQEYDTMPLMPAKNTMCWMLVATLGTVEALEAPAGGGDTNASSLSEEDCCTSLRRRKTFTYSTFQMRWEYVAKCLLRRLYQKEHWVNIECPSNKTKK